MHRFALIAVLLLVPANLLASPTVVKFKLNAIDGQPWSLDDCKSKAIVVVFIGTQCPVNNAYMPTLVELEKAYRDKGVQIVAINANEHDSLDAIKVHAKKFGLTFPVLRDEKQTVAKRFGADRHPTAFLLDDKHAIRYQGRIDDQFGIGFQRTEPTRRDLVVALDEVLAGKAVTTAKTTVAGCFITSADCEAGERRRHLHEGRIAHPAEALPGVPSSRPDRPDAAVDLRGRVELVGDDPRGGQRETHAALARRPEARQVHERPQAADDERTKLLAWIDAGCPEGDDKDRPPPKKFPEGWTIGKPDVVFTFKDAFTVPAKSVKGVMPYKNFVDPDELRRGQVDPGRRGQAGQSRGGAPHHRLHRAGKRDKRPRRHRQRLARRLRPGRLGSVFPPGSAKKVPKGATLRFPDALHAERHRADRQIVGRPDLRQGAAQSRGQDARHHPANLRDPAGRRESQGHQQDHLQQGRDAL